MRTAVLTRQHSADDGTFGILRLAGEDDGAQWYTCELPDRNNQPGISCIPPGTYRALWLLSPVHGWCYHLQAVPGRSEIEIHPANYCGDKALGLKCDLRGCIALGTDLGVLEGQRALLNSRAALRAFHERMNGEELELTIIGIPEPLVDPGGELGGGG